MARKARKPEHAALVALCGMMGLRVNEAISVGAATYNAVDKALMVNGKGGRWRVVPVPDQALRYLLPVIAHPVWVPLANRSARQAITNLGRRCKLQRSISSHDLRATFATAAYEASRDLRAVQELLGHASSNTTEVYTQISMNQMRSAMKGALA